MLEHAGRRQEAIGAPATATMAADLTHPSTAAVHRTGPVKVPTRATRHRRRASRDGRQATGVCSENCWERARATRRRSISRKVTAPHPGLAAILPKDIIRPRDMAAATAGATDQVMAQATAGTSREAGQAGWALSELVLWVWVADSSVAPCWRMPLTAAATAATMGMGVVTVVEAETPDDQAETPDDQVETPHDHSDDVEFSAGWCALTGSVSPVAHRARDSVEPFEMTRN